ncbi:hypothetical protein GKZ89_02910 [Bacillus mangrovi]|uniref:Uncharacterized protein n=1 Tax=Metabacillus mangrovi TaxID=1491830 RepID=A0A7X2S2T7_9BACI|nr:hypothetical protein [Metabacillus mangrovi]MTH52342.1 hypothetical protein [Metabacillus mangrovi]
MNNVADVIAAGLLIPLIVLTVMDGGIYLILLLSVLSVYAVIQTFRTYKKTGSVVRTVVSGFAAVIFSAGAYLMYSHLFF